MKSKTKKAPLNNRLGENNRIQCIPVLSFYFTCIFVIYHVVITVKPVNEFDSTLFTWMKTLNEQLATIALSYFFCVTGYLLFKNMNQKTIARKIGSRFLTLLVPYIFWQALVLGIFYLTGRYKTVSILIYYLKATFLFNGYPPDIPLWYVYAVFAWALLSPIILLLLKNKNIGFIVLMAAFIGIHFITTSKACSTFYQYGIIKLVLKYSYAYLMGAYFGLHFPDPKDLESLKYIAFTILLGFALSSYTLSEFRESFLIAAMPILLIRFFPDKLCKDRKIYKTSFIIFSIHYPIYQYLRDYLKTQDLSAYSASGFNIVIRILFLIGVIAISYLLYLLLSKFAPIVLKVMTGGRG